MPYPWECLDCTYLNPNDSKYGEYYCEHNRYYVKAASPSCRYFVKKSNSSGSSCYLTTAVVDILGYDDDCFFLNSLREFRDNYMKNNEEFKPLLDDYDTIGPKIVENLIKDEHKESVAQTMLSLYIKPAVVYIRNNMFDEAIDIYKEMTMSLADHYELDTTNLACNDKGVVRKK